jgi:hypothetical protein
MTNFRAVRLKLNGFWQAANKTDEMLGRPESRDLDVGGRSAAGADYKLRVSRQ